MARLRASYLTTIYMLSVPMLIQKSICRSLSRCQKQDRCSQIALKRTLNHWLNGVRKHHITAYRLYDADIPEYAVAIDVYGDWVHVQEYAAPKSIDQVKVFERLKDVIAAIPQVLEISPKRVVLKQRKRQSGTQQYEKQGI